MIPTGIHRTIRPRISTLSDAPSAATSLHAKSRLAFAVLLAALVSTPAFAQEAQTDGYGTGVIADTVEHTTPHPIPEFTDTPRAPRDEQAEEAQPATVHAEGLEDDFDNNTPTAWWMYTGETPGQGFRHPLQRQRAHHRSAGGFSFPVPADGDPGAEHRRLRQGLVVVLRSYSGAGQLDFDGKPCPPHLAQGL